MSSLLRKPLMQVEEKNVGIRIEEHREMTLLVGEEKLKFDLHQNMPLTDKEKMISMRIESLLPSIEEHASMFLQEDPL